jgi:quercetin dioxygenase-like cupin family protein
MITNAKTPVSLWRKLSIAAMVAGTTAILSTAALAGECPADKVGVDVTKAGATEPMGVTDEVIASIDLSAKGQQFADTMFRMRRLVVQPGGVVPWHSHMERPANIYIIDGSITEYNSNCAVPIEYAAGDVVAEFGDYSHWWKNNGSKPAVLISADIVEVKSDDQQTM